MAKYKKHGSFIMLARELINSPSWLSMSINGKRLLDFLFEEHLSKGGKENGNLNATYDQLDAAGIPRRLISRTITEAEFLGLITVVRGGRRGCVNDISTYTITVVGSFHNGRWIKPTEDWQKVTQEEITAFQHAHKIKSRLRQGTTTVTQRNNPKLHNQQS